MTVISDGVNIYSLYLLYQNNNHKNLSMQALLKILIFLTFITSTLSDIPTECARLCHFLKILGFFLTKSIMSSDILALSR